MTVAFVPIYRLFCDVFGDAVWAESTFRKVLDTSDYISYDDSPMEKGGVIIRKTLDEVEILNIAVHPDYQGQGIGTDLMARVLLYYADVRVYILEVAIDNVPAIQLYTSAGFEVVGIRPQYYNRPTGMVDGFIMRAYHP